MRTLVSYIAEFNESLEHGKKMSSYSDVPCIDIESQPNRAELTAAVEQFLAENEPRLPLAFNCVEVTDGFSRYMKEELNLESYCTVGWIKTKDGVLFHPDSVVKNPRSDLQRQATKLHAWITLPSLDVIDLTILPTLKVKGSLGYPDGLYYSQGRMTGFHGITHRPAVSGPSSILYRMP